MKAIVSYVSPPEEVQILGFMDEQRRRLFIGSQFWKPLGLLTPNVCSGDPQGQSTSRIGLDEPTSHPDEGVMLASLDEDLALSFAIFTHCRWQSVS